MPNLRDIINAATPGPWWVMDGTFAKRRDPKSATVYATNDDLAYVCRCDGSQMMFHDSSTIGIPDARHIAAYSPDHALLIEDALEAVLDLVKCPICASMGAGGGHATMCPLGHVAAYRKERGYNG